MKHCTLWLVLTICLNTPLTAGAAQVTVAVASNFLQPLKALAETFEAETGHRLIISSASSGKLYAQILHGAPFDIFLSADQQKPEALEQAGKIVPGSRFTYAVGRLALWSAGPDLIKDSPDILQTDQFERIALANPRLAPYGVAATEVMQALGVEARLRSKQVLGENIAQTYQFVYTGSARIGFVALSQLSSNGQIRSGSAWIIPDSLHSPVRQDAVQLRRSTANPAAAEFLQLLRSAAGQSLLEEYGYRFFDSHNDEKSESK